MKKYKGFLFIVSLVLVVAFLAGCSSNNPIAEELSSQRAVLEIGDFENGALTVNGDEVEPGWSDLFKVGDTVNLQAEAAPDYYLADWDNVEYDEEAEDITEIDLVVTEENTIITPIFAESNSGTGGTGDTDDGTGGEGDIVDEEDGNGGSDDPADDNGDDGEDEDDEFVDAVINPTTGTFNLDAPTNITTVINWNDAEAINAINLGEETLDTDDYEVLNTEDEVILVIDSEFFKDRALEAGDELTFEIEFNDGDNTNLVVEVIDQETDFDTGYQIDPDEVFENGNFAQEFTITLNNDDLFKKGAIVEAHITLGGDFAGLNITDIEKGSGINGRTNELKISLEGNLVKDTGEGYIGVSSARMVSEKPFIAWVDVLERLVDFESISFTTQRVISSSGNVNVDEDSEINAQTVEEGHVALELLNGTITGAKDPNKSLLNGEYDLLILVRDYEGDNDENGYPFTADFKDGTATGIDIPNDILDDMPEWKFNVDAGSISISLPGDLYLKFR